MLRAKQGSQAIVEFGLIALLFTLIMFAVIDFGLLLNTWLAVSSGSREIARAASVGKEQDSLQDMARHLNLPSVSTDGFSNLCCGTSSAVEVRVEYFSCTVSPWTCGNPRPASEVSRFYPLQNVDNTGSCTDPTQPPPPAPPVPNTCHPLADDFVRVTVVAHGAQVITPLVRPFFGCTNGVNPNCNVTLNSTTTMRVEGHEF
jgi:TadE-like protein